MAHPIIAIDPGASGGLAWIAADGVVCAEKMPDGMTATVDFLRHLAATLPGARATVEKVGSYVSGNSGPAAVTFAAHCGGLRWALYALGIPQDREPVPRTWQQALGVPVETALSKDMDAAARRRELAARKSRRKKWVQDAMQRMYPHLSVTLSTADALGILWYAMQRRDGGARE